MTIRQRARPRSAGGGNGAGRAPGTPRRMRATLGSGRAVETAIAVMAGLAAWEAVSRILSAAFLPPFSEVFGHLLGMIGNGEILGNLGRSLVNFAIGYAAALVIAVVVGMAMGASPKLYAALDPYINTMLTVPVLVFAPIFFTLFGLGAITIICVVALYAVFIMTVTVADAVRTVDPQLIEMARMFGASRWELFARIRFHAALPLMMAGFRLGAGRAVKGMINAEMFLAAVGLGAIVQEAGSQFDAVEVLAVLLVIVVAAVVIDQIATAIDRRVTSWLPSTQRS